MLEVEALRAAVKQRLTAAAEDILGLFEGTIAGYEELLRRSVQESERQRRLLDVVLKPEVRLHRTDVQQEPEPAPIKEEHEELWSSQEGEQLQGPVPIKHEDDEEQAQSSQLHQSQPEEEPPASSSAQQTETEYDGCGGSEPARSSDPESHQPANDDGTPDSSEPVDNSDGDWEQSRKSDFKTLTNSGVPEGVKEYNTGKKSLSCSKCGQIVDTKDCVQSHISPSEDKPFICSVCVQRSVQGAHLVPHKRSHSRKKAFRCSVCKKQFSYKGDVVRHIRIHTGEKPFSCLVCGKSFAQSTGLGSHMRTHTGEKPFSCSLCPKRFIRSGILARHMRVHTGEKPYSCSECNTRFSLSQSLLKHMRIHTGEKPFSCTVCDKKFTQKGHLTQHMTLHTGEKLFSCRVCSRKFTRQSRVKKHKCVTESSRKK